LGLQLTSLKSDHNYSASENATKLLDEMKALLPKMEEQLIRYKAENKSLLDQLS
jgi:hypothetical protein